VIFLVVSLLLVGVAYPLVVTGIADVINPAGAAGSLLKDPNGTVIGSTLIAQNTSPVPVLEPTVAHRLQHDARRRYASGPERSRSRSADQRDDQLHRAGVELEYQP